MRRSRAALFAAAVRVVSERGTTAVPVTDVADAADMSRQALYLHFQDRESLFVAAAIDLIERELFPQLARGGDAEGRELTLLAAQHLARYRAFYRALFSGPCAYPLKQAVIGLVRAARALDGRVWGGVDLNNPDAITTFLVGGVFAVFGQWLVDSDGPADPQQVTEQLLAVAATLRMPPG
ncbi:TetR/AcrR family transcriptional regulator [Nocardia sp. alder85J]|uniref:TetR/AcrR family transcriptional regulator n=1 Tax=Nocardia sp. alder85J TaxID=2862949 RepID=UPI001CD47C69|nr:TetR/AcrR family transcriptional regulator [Nocardia sp. alder85J]MCX4098375.1 helix-turn-helix domain containing protein [Nocardia sp. alder85J]